MHICDIGFLRGISELCENIAETETAASVDLLKQTPPGYSLLADSHWEASGCVSATAEAATSSQMLDQNPHISSRI